METLLEILDETPLWVYLIFLYLVISGLKASKPQNNSMTRATLLPIALIIWSLAELYNDWDWIAFLYWAIALVPGFIFGWLLVRSWKIQSDRRRKSLALPGSWSTFALLLVIFSVKYFFGYYSATHPLTPQMFLLAEMGVSGLVSGIFVGRIANFWKRYQEA